jgi:hypothetical protein
MAKPKPGSMKAAPTNKERTYLSQTDVPLFGLEKALSIPQAIIDNYGKGPAKPLEVAKVLEVTLTSSSFKMLAGASIAYGLTNGGWNAAQIELTPLALKILTNDNEELILEGKREAVLKPRVIGKFLTKYNDSAIPRPDIAYTVLEGFGVPKDRTADAFKMIMDSAESVGFITDIKGKKYGNLKGLTPPASSDSSEAREEDGETPQTPTTPPASSTPPHKTIVAPLAEISGREKKVFISHGKNKDFIEPIKTLLSFGQLEPVVSVEKSTVSQPITQKVMNDMRSCGAAIIHVDSERRLMDVDSKEQVALNENVLIEIGAAMALYGERYILLVKDGVKLPSNLQGLYEVRHAGDKLDGNETMKLMSSINDMKTKRLPG